MPEFTFTSPSGQKFSVTGPEGATKEQAFEKFKSMKPELFGAAPVEPAASGVAAPAPETKPRQTSALKYVGETLSNAPGDVAHMAKGLYDVATSPVQTAKGLFNLGYGAGAKIAEPAAEAYLNFMGRGPAQGVPLPANALAETRAAQAPADAALQGIQNKYGSLDKFAETFKKQPVSTLADLSMLLGGGGGLAKAGGLAETGRVLTTAGEVINPLAPLMRGAGYVAQAPIKGAQGVINYLNPQKTAILGAVGDRGETIVNALRANENMPGSMLTAGPAASGVGSPEFARFTGELAAKAPETYSAIEAQNTAARQAQLARVAEMTTQGEQATAAKLANVEQSTIGKTLIDAAKTAKNTIKTKIIEPAYTAAFKAAGDSKIDVSNVISKAEEILGQPLGDIKIPDMPDVVAKLAKLKPTAPKSEPPRGLRLDATPAPAATAATVTLEEADALRKAINKDVAAASAANTNPASATKLRDLRQLHDAIDAAIDSATKSGALPTKAKDIYDAAIALYRGPYVDRFKTGLNADITAKTIKNEEKINPSNVISQYLKDPRATDQLINLFKHNAKALDATKAGIESMYRDSVVKNGAVDPAAHAKFMTDYGQQLAALDQSTRMGIGAKLNEIGGRAEQLVKRRSLEDKLGKKVGEGSLPAGPQATAIQQKIADATQGLSKADLTSLAKMSQDLVKEAQQAQLAKTPNTLKSQLPPPMDAQINVLPSKIATVANYAFRKLANKVSEKQARALAEVFADPNAAADVIQKSLEWQARNAKLGAGAREITRKAAASPLTDPVAYNILSGAQSQNALSERKGRR
ncbi:hypothetical protein UFOVP165_7 [uncultured Caudovirales phage]|uniref:Uncharacterized protein n=1 Tax=uncultured Caudovirales phage TaxID=2100421 RepID=A0A6J5TB49_9CAUD|nr:hypothetical protein UFOVP72_36 [uncultured Caudovirales phage]CAB5187142.1 hypothetical protein UFOVP165_7 [uncultured Caudovirales phage]